MKNYLLKNIDAQLWREVKTYCAARDISVRELIINFLVGLLKKSRQH